MEKFKNTIFIRWKSRLMVTLLTFGFGVIVFSTFTSCSTKKNTFTRRAYHNLVAHYNTYWNGNESFKEGVRTLEKTAADNYTSVLPVFKFGNEQEAISVAFNMDRAIEKSSKVILKHSMYFKRKEYVRRVMDSYMLIGKSYLYKREYSNARRTFEWVSSFYDNDDIKYEADLWLAMTYNQNREFEKSSTMLDNLNKNIRNGKAPSSLDKQFQMVYADYFILQGDYQPAIKHLQRAIELNAKKKDKNRLRFILAQIYQEIGDMKEAARLYQLVIKKNPPYEMSINAKINLAKTYDIKRSNRSMIVKKLEKLLKDSKNTDYRDQIYYALADMYMKDNQMEQVIEYLTLSVATSVSNDYQKTLSSLKLADIYFEEPDYPLAQAYYDTAMQVLPREFPNYDNIKNKTEILTELITNLQVISTQDSLQNMARMPEAERNKLIDAQIKKIAEEEALRAEQEREAQRTVSMLEQTTNQQNRTMQQSGGWYFYNPSAVSFGYTEFVNKWGRRKLEDLWRLSNKQVILEFDELAEELEGDSLSVADTVKVETDPKKREFYLQNLPLTEEKVAASNAMIEDALFVVGYIYKDGLKDNLKSIESFEELLRRFPEHENLLMVYYQLYKNFEEVPDAQKADYYKNKIINDFPDTDYAKILLDPNYNLVVQARLDAASNFYFDTYSAYMSNQFYLVINNYNIAVERYQESELISKFEFLKALAFGKLQNLDTLKQSLEHIVVNYPESEVKPLAQEILNRLRPDETGQLVLLETPAASDEIVGEELPVEDFSTIYSDNQSAVHFFALVVDGSKTNINALKIRFSDFNSNYFKLSQLKINSLVFDNDLQLVTVGNFENAEKAMIYYRSAMNNTYITTPLESAGASSFVVTTDNYPLLYREKDVNSYLQFFERNYLNE
ncbi:MAG: tetratricopeptide repeat protein [Bacteroidales bacterium]|nr:tetratricopeptide repeat protein [Bacteroidales bacterium]